MLTCTRLLLTQATIAALGTLAVASPAVAYEDDSPSRSWRSDEGCEVVDTSVVVDTADEGETVVVGVTGPLPADVSDALAGVFAELDGQAGPVAMTIVETVDGVEAEVTGVTGELPVDLSQEIATALGCTTTDAAGAEATGGDANSADQSCEVVDTSAVVDTADEGETVVVGVTGPLPADVSDALAGVFAELDGQAGPVAMTIVETVDGVEAEVTGVTGELPVDLSQEIATALGCTTEETTDEEGDQTDGEGDETAQGDGDTGGEASTEDGSDATTDEAATDESAQETDKTAVLAGGAGKASTTGEELPRTGGGGLLTAVGTLLAASGALLRRVATRG